MTIKAQKPAKPDKELTAIPTQALYAALTLLSVSLGVSSAPAKNAVATTNAGNQDIEGGKLTGSHQPELQELLSARCKGCPKGGGRVIDTSDPTATNQKPAQNMQSNQIKLQSNQQKLPSGGMGTKR